MTAVDNTLRGKVRRTILEDLLKFLSESVDRTDFGEETLDDKEYEDLLPYFRGILEPVLLDSPFPIINTVYDQPGVRCDIAMNNVAACIDLTQGDPQITLYMKHGPAMQFRDDMYILGTKIRDAWQEYAKKEERAE